MGEEIVAVSSAIADCRHDPAVLRDEKMQKNKFYVLLQMYLGSKKKAVVRAHLWKISCFRMRAVEKRVGITK